MTLQELGHIDELIAWLDNELDGAEDAGFFARSATNWHPALVALRASLATAEAANQRNLGLLEVIEQQGVELEATKQRLATAEADATRLLEQLRYTLMEFGKEIMSHPPRA